MVNLPAQINSLMEFNKYFKENVKENESSTQLMTKT